MQSIGSEFLQFLVDEGILQIRRANQGEGTPLKNRTLCAKIRSPFLTPPHPPEGGWGPLAPRRVSAGASDFFLGFKNLY